MPAGLGQVGEQRLDRGVIAKGLAHMREAVEIAGTKDKTPAQLKGILAESVLRVAGRLGSRPRLAIVAAENVE